MEGEARSRKIAMEEQEAAEAGVEVDVEEIETEMEIWAGKGILEMERKGSQKITKK